MLYFKNKIRNQLHAVRDKYLTTAFDEVISHKYEAIILILEYVHFYFT